MVEEIPSRAVATAQETSLEEEQNREREQEREFRAAPKLNKSPLHGLWALTNRDLVKWYKNPIQLIISLIQPVVWLGLFGKALNFGSFISSGISSSNICVGLSATACSAAKSAAETAAYKQFFGVSSYFSFLSAGMLAFIILFTAAFAGMSVVWDRRFGFMNKAMSTPVGRGAIVIGKILQSVIRSLIQAAIVLVIAIVLGMDTSNMNALTIAGAFTILFLMAFGLSSLFVMLALRSSDWQTQMAIINLLNLPLLFASNAMLPTSIMPSWLQTIVKFNPVSYANDATRQLLLGSTLKLAPLWVDFSVLTGFAAVLAILGIVMSWKLLSK
jgi:ABC-2 type transport system permease protein